MRMKHEYKMRDLSSYALASSQVPLLALSTTESHSFCFAFLNFFYNILSLYTCSYSNESLLLGWFSSAAKAFVVFVFSSYVSGTDNLWYPLISPVFSQIFFCPLRSHSFCQCPFSEILHMSSTYPVHRCLPFIHLICLSFLNQESTNSVSSMRNQSAGYGSA